MRLLALLAVLAAMALAGCGGGGDGGEEYPAEAVDTFMDSCTAQKGATQVYCRCVIDGLQEELTYDEFKKLDAAIATKQDPDEDSQDIFVEAVADCREP